MLLKLLILIFGMLSLVYGITNNIYIFIPITIVYWIILDIVDKGEQNDKK